MTALRRFFRRALGIVLLEAVEYPHLHSEHGRQCVVCWSINNYRGRPVDHAFTRWPYLHEHALQFDWKLNRPLSGDSRVVGYENPESMEADGECPQSPWDRKAFDQLLFATQVLRGRTFHYLSRGLTNPDAHPEWKIARLAQMLKRLGARPDPEGES